MPISSYRQVREDGEGEWGFKEDEGKERVMLKMRDISRDEVSSKTLLYECLPRLIGPALSSEQPL